MKQSMLISALALLSVSAMAAAEPVAVEQQAPAAVIKQVEPAQVQLKKALNLSAEQMPHWDKMETTFECAEAAAKDARHERPDDA